MTEIGGPRINDASAKEAEDESVAELGKDASAKRCPSQETISAMQEAEDLATDPDAKRYSVGDALAELKK